jgi:hypothetical protein
MGIPWRGASGSVARHDNRYAHRELRAPLLLESNGLMKFRNYATPGCLITPVRWFEALLGEGVKCPLSTLS